MADSFDMLGLPRSWRLTAQEIRTAQRKCSIVAHPDRQPDPVARQNSLQQASRINAAANELLDPMSRGNALLKSFEPRPKPTDPKPTAEFLMSMMALREAVDAATQDKQARAVVVAQVSAQLSAIELETDAAMMALIKRPEPDTWCAAFDALNRLRSMRRAHAECAQ